MMNLSRSSHTDDSITFNVDMDLSGLLYPADGGSVPARKDSNSSHCEPSFFSDCSGHAQSSSNASLEDSVPSLPPLQHHLSLPEINFSVRTADQSAGFSTPIARSPSIAQSLSPLQDIPEGVQMELHSPMPVVQSVVQFNGRDQHNLYDYRNASPIPSSPSVASTSTSHPRYRCTRCCLIPRSHCPCLSCVRCWGRRPMSQHTRLLSPDAHRSDLLLQLLF